MSLNSRITDEAIRWAEAKVPYLHMGTKITGCDCTGLLIGVVQSLGYLKDFKLDHYSIDWNLNGDNENILEGIKKYCHEVSKKTMVPGDLLLFRFGNARAGHAGIYIGNGLFVHSKLKGKYCKYATLRKSLWGRRLTEVHRVNDDLS